MGGGGGEGGKGESEPVLRGTPVGHQFLRECRESFNFSSTRGGGPSCFRIGIVTLLKE